MTKASSGRQQRRVVKRRLEEEAARAKAAPLVRCRLQAGELKVDINPFTPIGRRKRAEGKTLKDMPTSAT